MKLLLLSLTILLYMALGSPPAPLNLSISSENYRHTLHWTPGPRTPPGARYLIYDMQSIHVLANTTETWVDLTLDPTDTYVLKVRSRFNDSLSPFSKKISFTPYVDTTITAPIVVLSGCGHCIQVNFTLPRPHNSSKIKDILEVYHFLIYRVSFKKQGQELEEHIETRNQTMVIEHLLPASNYCVQVKPEYLYVKFQASPWKCVFTSIQQPPQVFAAVVAVAALVILCASALTLVLVSLQYAGILCKLKETLPNTIITVLSPSSLLNPERTIPQPVTISPEPEKLQPSSSTTDSSSDEEDHLEESAAQYMDRGADLSSGSSSSGGHVTQKSQSAAVPEQSGNLTERVYEGKPDEKLQNEAGKVELIKKETRVSEEQDRWDEVLENSGDVNLFSVTVAALDLHPEPYPSDLEPLLHTDFQSEMCSDSHLPQQQQQQLSDMEEEEDDEMELSNYMCH